MSMVTLTIAAAMFTQYWDSSFGITAATFILLLALFLMNACGVQLYGRMEWVFKWLKFALLFGLILLMILIRAGGERRRYSMHILQEADICDNSWIWQSEQQYVPLPQCEKP